MQLNELSALPVSNNAKAHTTLFQNRQTMPPKDDPELQKLRKELDSLMTKIKASWTSERPHFAGKIILQITVSVWSMTEWLYALVKVCGMRNIESGKTLFTP